PSHLCDGVKRDAIMNPSPPGGRGKEPSPLDCKRIPKRNRRDLPRIVLDIDAMAKVEKPPPNGLPSENASLAHRRLTRRRKVGQLEPLAVDRVLIVEDVEVEVRHSPKTNTQPSHFVFMVDQCFQGPAPAPSIPRLTAPPPPHHPMRVRVGRCPK